MKSILTIERKMIGYSISKKWLDGSEKYLSADEGEGRGINTLTSSFDRFYDNEVADESCEINDAGYWKNYEGAQIRKMILQSAIHQAKVFLADGQYPATLEYIKKNF
tara:strand:+ start:1963 stop:2283 length:321 start_codon:yes stop_codon:yes gene_type:complete